MTVDRLTHSDHIPAENSDDVHLGSEDQRTDRCGQQVSKSKLDRMAILSSDRHSLIEGVVHLMDVGVEHRQVQHSMRPVEREILADHTEEY